jgi:hypothetical protein
MAAASRTFLVECYSPVSREGATSDGDGLHRACAGLKAMGSDLDYLGALVVPGDELVMYLFVAADVAAVREAARRAGLVVERIVESIAIGPPPSRAILVPHLAVRDDP